MHSKKVTRLQFAIAAALTLTLQSTLFTTDAAASNTTKDDLIRQLFEQEMQQNNSRPARPSADTERYKREAQKAANRYRDNRTIKAAEQEGENQLYNERSKNSSRLNQINSSISRQQQGGNANSQGYSQAGEGGPSFIRQDSMDYGDRANRGIDGNNRTDFTQGDRSRAGEYSQQPINNSGKGINNRYSAPNGFNERQVDNSRRTDFTQGDRSRAGEYSQHQPNNPGAGIGERHSAPSNDHYNQASGQRNSGNPSRYNGGSIRNYGSHSNDGRNHTINRKRGGVGVGGTNQTIKPNSHLNQNMKRYTKDDGGKEEDVKTTVHYDPNDPEKHQRWQKLQQERMKLEADRERYSTHYKKGDRVDRRLNSVNQSHKLYGHNKKYDINGHEINSKIGRNDKVHKRNTVNSSHEMEIEAGQGDKQQSGGGINWFSLLVKIMVVFAIILAALTAFVLAYADRRTKRKPKKSSENDAANDQTSKEQDGAEQGNEIVDEETEPKEPKDSSSGDFEGGN